MTRSQNLAPSVCSIHSPRISLVPSARTPSATWMALLRTRASSRILTRSASKKISGETGSSGRACQAAISSKTASVTALIRSGETSMPYSSRRCPTISRVLMPRAYIEITLFVETRKAALVLGDQLGIEAGLAIAWDLQIQLARVSHDRLVAIAVAAVAGPSFAREMMIHLGIEGALGERLLQVVQQAVRIKGCLGRPQPKAGPGWHQEYEALCV